MMFRGSCCMIIVTLALLFLLAIPRRLCQYLTSPCPEVFQYGINSNNELYGIIQVPYPGTNILQMDVEISLGNNVGEYKGKLTPVDRTLNDERLIRYNVYFPPWQNVPPKITKIIFNNQLICTGPSVSFQETTRVTTVKLWHILPIDDTIKLIAILESETKSPTILNGTISRYFVDDDAAVIPNAKRENKQVADHPENGIPQKSPLPLNSSPKANKEKPEESSAPFTSAPLTAKEVVEGVEEFTSRPLPNDTIEFLNDVCGRPSSTIKPLIANGINISPGTFPWLSALFFLKGTNPVYKCSSSLISHKHVVTAAYCVKVNGRVVDPKDLLIVLGKLNIKKWSETEGEKKVDAKSIHIHPDYKPLSSDANIAIIVLAFSVEFTNFIQPICLWRTNSNLQRIEGQSGTVVGWSKNDAGDLVAPEPKQFTMFLVSQKDCLRSSSVFKQITSNRTFCAEARNGKGPCNGETGSGFIMKRGRVWYLRGIVSIFISNANTRTCDLSQYVTFTDTAKFTTWLLSFISK